LGAVFVDQGFAAARKVILRLFNRRLKRVIKAGSTGDCKSRLQELAQAKRQATPIYRVVETSGPAHDRVFTVEVVVGDAVLGRGRSKGKKVAEQESARLALQGWTE
jgi:ribonuclease-3